MIYHPNNHGDMQPKSVKVGNKTFALQFYKPEGAPCLRQEHAGGIQEVSPGPHGGLEILVVDLHGLDGTCYRDR